MDALVGWTANTDPDLAGYHVYHGVQSGIYYESFVVLAPTITRSFMGLDDYHTHYFAVSAYDTTGNESALSDEVSKTPASPVSPGQSKGRFLYLVSMVLLLLLVGLSGAADAATYAAASCSNANVTTAIGLASDGDTVTIPSGSCTWTSAVSTSKGITIQGAGIGVTNITNNGFDMSGADGTTWRLTAMTFAGTACVNVLTESKAWRIDHIHFNTVSPGAGRCENRLIWIAPTGPGYQKGLIDHNTFTDPGAIQIHMRVSGDGGNGEYLRALDLGGSDAVYIEDNTFAHSTLQVSNPTTDCDGGGRLVFRYNTVQNSYFEMHDAIVPALRSCRKWEVYNNTFEMTYDSSQFVFIGIRGGTGIVANNTFDTNGFYMGNPIVVALYRTGQVDSDPWDVLCSNTSGKFYGGSTTPPGGCTGTANGCITMDGPGTGAQNGYPCRDQFGFDGNDPQTTRPALFWGNTMNGSANNNFDFNGPDPTGNANYIVQNRDWCGSASMPSTCNGVSTTYTAYTYPHPLQGGSDTTPPSVPAGVYVVEAH